MATDDRKGISVLAASVKRTVKEVRRARQANQAIIDGTRRDRYSPDAMYRLCMSVARPFTEWYMRMVAAADPDGYRFARAWVEFWTMVLMHMRAERDLAASEGRDTEKATVDACEVALGFAHMVALRVAMARGAGQEAASIALAAYVREGMKAGLGAERRRSLALQLDHAEVSEGDLHGVLDEEVPGALYVALGELYREGRGRIPSLSSLITRTGRLIDGVAQSARKVRKSTKNEGGDDSQDGKPEYWRAPVARLAGGKSRVSPITWQSAEETQMYVRDALEKAASLASLSPEEQRATMLSDQFGDGSAPEVGMIMRVDANTVRTTRFRARRKLRSVFADRAAVLRFLGNG